MGNLLDALCEELARLEAEGRPLQIINHAICEALLSLALGEDWSSIHVRLCSSPDPWMLNGNQKWLDEYPVPTPDLRRVMHFDRTARLADALFTLLTRDVEGFDLLRQRFRTRATEPCFHEGEIASLLAYNGFKVSIIQETGTKGEDFDLLAERDGKTTSIEVTSKEPGTLTRNTIVNTLKAKRKQVPSSRPAVLYMKVPAEWMHTPRVTYRVLTGRPQPGY